MQQKQQKSDYEQHLEEHERQKHERPASNVSEMLSFMRTMMTGSEPRSLKGIETNQLPAYILSNKLDGETLEDCYQRLKHIELEEEREYGEKTQ